MKTIIAAIICLLLNASSFAQIIAAEGFFDTDPGVGNGYSMSIAPNGSVTNFSSALPTSISSGLHTLYARTCSASHLWSVSRGRLVIVDQTAFLPPQIIEVDKCEYFIGNDPGVGNGTNVPITLNVSIASITQNILTNLPPGFYNLSLRFRSTEQVWSVPRVRTFYVRAANDNQVADEIVDAEFFIGTTDPGVGNGTSIPLSALGDPVSFISTAVTNLTPGIYMLNIRFKSSVGLWSVSRSRYFNVIDEGQTQIAEEIVSAEYFVDADPGVGQGFAVNLANPAQSVQIAHEALMSSGLGTHILFLRTRSNRQLWSVPRGRPFIVTNDPVYPVNEIVYAEYFIDSDPGEGNGIAMSIIQGNIVPLDGTISTTGINPGEHTMYVRVQSNLGLWSQISSQTFVITSETPVVDITEISPLCHNSSDGQINVELFGGSSTYSYAWDGVPGTNTLNNISQGVHHLVITDADNSVVLDTTITVVAPQALAYTSQVDGVSCFGDNNGSAIVTTSGGTGSSSIDWNGADPSNLSGGDHNFTITDDNGCTLSGTVTVAEPAVLTATSAVTPTTNEAICDGSITVTTSGGTQPYTYTWTPDAPDAAQISDLCTGNYSVTITDANGCTTDLSDVLITVDLSVVRAAGFEINTSPNPGNGNFQISISTAIPMDMSWKVLDAQGRLVTASQGKYVAAGQTKFALDLTASANGTYFLQLNLNQQPVTVQLVIEK